MSNNIHIINGPVCLLKSNKLYTVNYWSTIRPIGAIWKIIRSLRLKLNNKAILDYYDYSFLDNISDDDIIILFDCMCQQNVMDEIERRCALNRKILYYWNPLSEQKHKSINYNGWEVWTFDPSDAKKFNLKYAGQFVDDILLSQVPLGNSYNYDLCFVGIDKGRFVHLRILMADLNDKLRLNFRLVSPLKSLYNKEYSKRIPYIKCIEEEMSSKAILEYAQKGQIGLTLRAVESIYLQRKLVTNNSKIKNYSFYTPNNTFILQNDETEGLVEFMERPLEFYSEETRTFYSFSSWLDRIINNKESNDYI